MSVISNASADSYMKDFEGRCLLCNLITCHFYIGISLDLPQSTFYSNILGGGNTAEEDGSEDLTQSELFEEKLRETIDLATQKSANGKLIS